MPHPFISQLTELEYQVWMLRNMKYTYAEIEEATGIRRIDLYEAYRNAEVKLIYQLDSGAVDGDGPMFRRG